MTIKVTKMPLSWYEDEAAEINYNADGSVTFVFDEPAGDDHIARTGSTTISKEEYERAKEDPAYKI